MESGMIEGATASPGTPERAVPGPTRRDRSSTSCTADIVCRPRWSRPERSDVQAPAVIDAAMKSPLGGARAMWRES